MLMLGFRLGPVILTIFVSSLVVAMGPPNGAQAILESVRQLKAEIQQYSTSSQRARSHVKQL